MCQQNPAFKRAPPTKKFINEKKPAPTNSLSQNGDILLAINKNNNKEIKEILISIAQNLQ